MLRNEGVWRSGSRVLTHYSRIEPAVYRPPESILVYVSASIKHHVPSLFNTDVLPLLQLWLVYSYLDRTSLCKNFAGEAGAEDCETTVTMSNVNNGSVVYVPPTGTVCFNCSNVIIFGFDVEFIISEMVDKSSYIMTQKKSINNTNYTSRILVVDSGKAFSTSSAEIVKCCEEYEGECLWHPDIIYYLQILWYYSKCYRQ